MLEYIDTIRKIAEKILKEGTVEMVIGFRRGTVPLMNEPHFARKPEDVKNLVWDSNCGINLANYLTDCKGKIGIVAKGCDSRNIVVHMLENQIKREQLYILGAPCHGMLDRRRIAAELKGKEPTDVEEANGKVRVTGRDFEVTLDRAASKGNIHPNNAARRKSRLTKKLNAALATKQ